MNRDGKEKKITVFFCISLTYSTPLALCAQYTFKIEVQFFGVENRHPSL